LVTFIALCGSELMTGAEEKVAPDEASTASDPVARCEALGESEEDDADDQAEACFEILAKDSTASCFHRGRAYRELAAVSPAKGKRKIFEEALEACPGDGTTRVAFGKMLANRAETRAETLAILEAGIPYTTNSTELGQLYRTIGLIHRVLGNLEPSINAFKQGLEHNPMDNYARKDFMELLQDWNAVPLNQTDMFNAPVFTKKFNKKGLRVIKVPKRGGQDADRKIKATRVNAYPRVVTLDGLLTKDECEELLLRGTKLVSDWYTPQTLELSASGSSSGSDAVGSGESGEAGATPLWCFENQDILGAMLKNSNASHLVPPAEAWLPETQGRCLNRDASDTLTQSGKLRWSRTHNIYRGELPLLDEIDYRLEKGLGLAAAHGAGWQITSYDQQEGYTKHTDCVVGDSVSVFKRIATVLIYLTDVEEGGETVFDRMNVKVKPGFGKAVVWRNLDSEGECNILTEHTAKPVVKGRKVIMQRWYYEEAKNLMNFRPGPPPLQNYTKGTPLIACDDEDMCRQYNDWTVNWANWKGFK